MAHKKDNLEKVIKTTIEEIRNDTDLCYKYESLCSFTSSEENISKVVEGAVKLIEEGVDNIFEALSSINNQLYTED